MTIDVDTYRQQLLLALRLRDVPGPRIAQVLAEVESHIAETGEDPRAAFGAPRDYARALVAELQPERTAGRRGWGAGTRGVEVLLAALAFAGAWLTAEGVFALASGRPGRLGLTGAGELGIAVVLLAALALLLARTGGRTTASSTPGPGVTSPPPFRRGGHVSPPWPCPSACCCSSC